VVRWGLERSALVITENTLPKNIESKVKKYFNPEKDFDYQVFPSKIFVDDKLYYSFIFRPSLETLLIQEDGVIPPKNEVKKVALFVSALNTSLHNISTIGFKWAKASDKKGLRKLSMVIKKIKSELENKASADIIRAIESFQYVIEMTLKHQEIIEKSVENGLRLAATTNDREIVTEDDYKKMRKYNLDMVRSAYLQNEIQLETESDRRIVLKYLLRKPKYWPLYLYIMYHDMKMLSSRYPNKVREMQSIKNMIFEEDVPLEKQPNAEDVIRLLRNP
jgi:hypothetical protein